MLFNNKFTTIDIGTNAIKLARFKKSKNTLTLLNTAYQKLSYDTIRDGMIVDIPIVAKCLKNILSGLDFKPRKIVTTIPSNHIITRNVEFPIMSDDELEQAMKWEAEEYLPFSIEEARLDYLLIDQDEETLKILLVAVKQDILDKIQATFTRIGLKPKILNIQPMALLSLLKYQDAIVDEETVAVIDLGASSTQVVVGDQKNIYLSRSIDIGGQNFTNHLMEIMQIDFLKAEEHKFENGIEDSDDKYSEGETFSEMDISLSEVASVSGESLLGSLVDDLTEEISRSLEYYSMKSRGKAVDKIYLTGGGSRLQGIKGLISEHIDRDILLLNPFENFNIENARNDLAEEFGVAIGLGVSEVLADES